MADRLDGRRRNAQDVDIAGGDDVGAGTFLVKEGHLAEDAVRVRALGDDSLAVAEIQPVGALDQDVELLRLEIGEGLAQRQNQGLTRCRRIPKPGVARGARFETKQRTRPHVPSHILSSFSV
jgi:hypothetical protein